MTLLARSGLQSRPQLDIFAKFAPSFGKLPKLQTLYAKPLDTFYGAFWQIIKMQTSNAEPWTPTVIELDFAFLKFAKNLKNYSPTILHLTYVFWQTWHLMDQTYHFCIGAMAWQF
jgi:hypothetical protein